MFDNDHGRIVMFDNDHGWIVMCDNDHVFPLSTTGTFNLTPYICIYR